MKTGKDLIKRIDLEVSKGLGVLEDIVEEILEGDIAIDEAKEILTRIKDYRAIEEILSEDEEEQKITHKIIQIKRIKRLIKEGNIEDMKIIFGSQLNA